MAALKYRTDDGGQWGTGLGRDLNPEEIDQNFYDVETRLDAVETNPAMPAEIDAISVEGNQLTITLSDNTVFGPYALPQAAFRFTGAFQPTHDYKKYDFLTANSGLYMVLHNFTSGASFVFGSDADGPFYQFIMPFPDFYDIGFFFPGKPGTGIAAGATMLAFRTTARTPFYLPAALPELVRRALGGAGRRTFISDLPERDRHRFNRFCARQHGRHLRLHRRHRIHRW